METKHTYYTQIISILFHQTLRSFRYGQKIY